MPFLRNVTAGRDVPDERLAEVAEHYELVRRREPDQRAEPRSCSRRCGEQLAPRRVYWGNRNWEPYLRETLAADARRRGAPGGCVRHGGVRVVLVLPPVPGGPRRCRSPRGLQLDKLRHYYNHPRFIAAQAEQVVGARGALRPDARLLFTAHSIPLASARSQRPARRRLSGAARRSRPAGRRCRSGSAPAGAVSSRSRGRADPARRACPGWSRTSTTGWWRWPPTGVARCRRRSGRLRQRSCRGALRPRHRGRARPRGRVGIRFARAGTVGRQPIRSSRWCASSSRSGRQRCGADGGASRPAWAGTGRATTYARSAAARARLAAPQRATARMNRRTCANCERTRGKQRASGRWAQALERKT